MICHLFLVQELSCDPLQVAYIEPVQMGPINPDYAELHFIGVSRLLLSSQRVAARLPTGSPGLLFSDWFPTAVHLLHTTTTNIPSFSDASFFAAWMGRVMRQPPVISRLFSAPTPNHLFPTVCDGRCSETCPAPDSANLGGLLVIVVSFQ